MSNVPRKSLVENQCQKAQGKNQSQETTIKETKSENLIQNQSQITKIKKKQCRKTKVQKLQAKEERK